MRCGAARENSPRPPVGPHTSAMQQLVADNEFVISAVMVVVIVALAAAAVWAAFHWPQQ